MVRCVLGVERPILEARDGVGAFDGGRGLRDGGVVVVEAAQGLDLNRKFWEISA